MNGDDPLDALFDDLRQPATPSELANESNAIDALLTTMMPPKGSSMRLLSDSRRLRVASFVAAGILGFSGAAAAGPAVYDTVTGGEEPKTEESVEEPSDTVVDTTMATETTETETTTTSSVPDNDDSVVDPVVATTDGEIDELDEVDEVDEVDEGTTIVELVDDPDTEFDETTCAEGNHGQTVSSIAHETPSGPGKGQIVSEAAHSSCGKADKHDKESDDESDDQSEQESDDQSDQESDDQSDDDKPAKPSKADKPGKSGGHGSATQDGKGNSSNGKGGGKRQDG
jgi:hypothetical protein